MEKQQGGSYCSNPDDMMAAGTNQVVTVEVVRSSWMGRGYVLKVESIGIVYGLDVECEKKVKADAKARWPEEMEG